MSDKIAFNSINGSVFSTKAVNPWDRSLTDRLRYLLIFEPLLALRKLATGDPELTTHFKHYDPLAIALKIIELIIDNTTIILNSSTAGITRTELYIQIQPFLSLIDQQSQVELDDVTHTLFIDKILNHLLSSDKTIHGLTYVDYSVLPPVAKRIDFSIIYTETSTDEQVQFFADPATINLFANILDMKLEDQQQANLYILDKQIQRGDLQRANETARANARLTTLYVQEIQKIIDRTKRKYQLGDWQEEFPKKLDEAEKHINSCLLTQRRQYNEILVRYHSITEENFEEYVQVQGLQDNLLKSTNLLLPLQNKINSARKAFYDEQIPSIFYSEHSNMVELEKDIFMKSLLLPKAFNESLLEIIFPFFNHCSIPHVSSLEQMINLSLSRLTTKPRTPKKKIDIEPPKRILRPEFFSEDLKNTSLRLLVDLCEKNNNKISLQNALMQFSSNKMPLDHLIYICLFFEGRYAIPKFEWRYLKRPVSIDWADNNFEFNIFSGRDMIMQLGEE